MEAFDLGAMYAIAAKRTDALTAFVRTLTSLGEMPYLFSAGLIGTGLLVVLRQTRPAVVFALTGLGAWGVSESTKVIVDRPRPAVVSRLIPLPGNPSFPSGHALCSLAIYGCLGLLLGRLAPRRLRWLPPLLGIALGVAIGLTRPYLGVHWPTDVIAGWVGGLGCAFIGAAMAEPGEKVSALPPA